MLQRRKKEDYRGIVKDAALAGSAITGAGLLSEGIPNLMYLRNGAPRVQFDNWMQNRKLRKNARQEFGYKRNEKIDEKELRKRYRQKNIEVHPDKFVGDPVKQSWATKRSAQLGEYHTALTKPISQADMEIGKYVKNNLTKVGVGGALVGGVGLYGLHKLMQNRRKPKSNFSNFLSDIDVADFGIGQRILEGTNKVLGKIDRFSNTIPGTLAIAATGTGALTGLSYLNKRDKRSLRTRIRDAGLYTVLGMGAHRAAMKIPQTKAYQNAINRIEQNKGKMAATLTNSVAQRFVLPYGAIAVGNTAYNKYAKTVNKRRKKNQRLTKGVEWYGQTTYFPVAG